ncbi:MAG: hypothetical protein QM736_14680 [Vicinamibacterales bacterium]
MDIRFGDHASFHKAALGMVGSSLLFGLALHPVTSWPVAPVAGGVLGIACGAAIAHGRAPWRMLAAAAAIVPLFTMKLGWPMLAVIASILALGVAVGGHRGVKGLLSIGLGAATALLGMWCALKISTAYETRNWPEWIRVRHERRGVRHGRRARDAAAPPEARARSRRCGGEEPPAEPRSRSEGPVRSLGRDLEHDEGEARGLRQWQGARS